VSPPHPRRASAAARLAVVLACALVGADLRAAAPEQRFALIVGNDSGGRDTRPLLYAAEDARRIHDVLVQLGFVKADDAVLLLNKRADDFERALRALEVRAAVAHQVGAHTALVVYYSGHARDGALRLGDSGLSLDELKARLQRIGSDVVVGIFDSCRSGVITRTKGARHAPAFDVQTNGMEAARGTVFLTSSSADEDAQESDEIRGSYFSHNLENGLRGVADQSNDGRVTLSEAYAYAYARTVADTAESAAGAQHPTFSYDLKGNGDLVLTEYGGRSEGLLVPAEAPAGTYYIVRNEIIAAEVVKPAGAAKRIALRPASYVVKRRLADRLRVGKVEIARGTLAVLDESHLRDVPFSDDPVKGVRRGPFYSLGLAGTVQSFFDAPTREGLFPPSAMLGAELQLHDFFRRSWVVGLDVAAGGARATLVRPTGLVLPFQFKELSAGASLFTEWPLLEGHLVPFVGGRLAMLFLSRTFEGTELPKQSFSTFSPGLLVGLRYRFTSGLSALARARIHYLLYNVDENRSLGYWELAVAINYEF
jgi:hypothetical protein